MNNIFNQLPKNVSAKHLDIFGFSPRFVIVDDSELLFFTAGFDTNLKNTLDSGLWTNNKSLILSFRVFFDQLWEKAVDLKEQIELIKSGQEPTKTKIIKNTEEANQLFLSTFNSAKKEVLIMATEHDMPIMLSIKELFLTLKNRGVNINVLIPLKEHNKHHAKELATFCNITNIQTNYFRTVIIDAKHLFQFKTAIHHPEGPINYFQSVFYTNDTDFAQGRRELLIDLQKQSSNYIDQLKFSETRFRAIFENSNDAIILGTLNGEIVLANKSACKIFNMTEAEIKKAGRSNLLVHDQTAQAAMKEYETKGHTKVEATYKRSDGTTFQGETHASCFIDADGKTKVSVIIRDITERKKTEEILKNCQTRLNAIFSLLNIGIYIENIEGKITHSNPAFQQIMGYTQEELYNKSLLELTHPEDRPKIKKLYRDLLQGKTENATLDQRNVRKDDKIIRVKLNLSVLTRDKDGKPKEYIATLEDITVHADIRKVGKNRNY